MMRTRSHFIEKRYATRLDRFRVREGIAPPHWADEAGMARTQLGKYRSGEQEPYSNTLADLVRSASRILRRPVRASELYDIGEDTPVAPKIKSPPRRVGNQGVRKLYSSRLEKLLVRIGWPPTAFAQHVGISRQALGRIRDEETFPLVSTIRRIVATCRRMGYQVTASDVVDVGEDSHS